MKKARSDESMIKNAKKGISVSRVFLYIQTKTKKGDINNNNKYVKIGAKATHFI